MNFSEKFDDSVTSEKEARVEKSVLPRSIPTFLVLPKPRNTLLSIPFPFCSFLFSKGNWASNTITFSDSNQRPSFVRNTTNEL